MIEWRLQSFSEMSAAEVYLLMQLRQDVFVVEQNCVFPDLDGKDFPSLHLSAWTEDKPAAYLRILPPEVHESGCPSLGRICTAMSARRTGLGQELVRRGIDIVRERWPGQDCQIGAQAYLQRFYESFRFVVNGDQYIEDGIPHFPMRLKG